MANTMVKIQTITVGASTAASIDFTNIPQNFTDLKIFLSARTNRASQVTDFVSIIFNSNTSNRTYRELYATGGAAGTGSGSLIAGPLIPGSTTTASVFGNAEIYILNYASSNSKIVSVDSVSENNGTEALLDITGSTWANSSAITSISLVSNSSANFVQFSSATLYGIKKA